MPIAARTDRVTGIFVAPPLRLFCIKIPPKQSHPRIEGSKNAKDKSKKGSMAKRRPIFNFSFYYLSAGCEDHIAVFLATIDRFHFVITVAFYGLDVKNVDSITQRRLTNQFPLFPKKHFVAKATPRPRRTHRVIFYSVFFLTFAILSQERFNFKSFGKIFVSKLHPTLFAKKRCSAMIPLS